MNLIMLGASGSGKGTHAKFIERDFGPVPISTGDLLREEIAKQNPVALDAKQNYMDKGLLVPDEIVLKILKQRLAKPDVTKKGFILDGYPRNIEQAKALESIAKFDRVIFIDLAIEEVMNRLMNRYTCKSCQAIWNGISENLKLEDKCPTCGGELYVRSDDAPDKVKNRIAFFTDNIDALLDFYKDKVVKVKSEPLARREDNYAPIYKAIKEFIDAK